MAAKFLLLATQLALATAGKTPAPTPPPCHPKDGHEYNIYIHGYVSNLNDFQGWFDAVVQGLFDPGPRSYSTAMRAMRVWSGPRSEATLFLFKGVPGFCNQYKLQSRNDNYWVGFSTCGSHCFRALYSESDADPILFKDHGNGTYVLKSAWPSHEYGSSVRADSADGYLSYSSHRFYECGEVWFDHSIRPGYGYSSAMVVSLFKQGVGPSEESEESYSRAFVVEPVIGFFAGCAVAFVLLRGRYHAASAPEEPLLTA